MKLRKYNSINTYPHLDQLQPYWSKYFLGHLIEKYKKIQLEQINHCFVDRTSAIPHFLKMEIEPLPPLLKVPPDTFDECVVFRVLSLLDKKKPINLMWSGGLDSTAMLGAFLTIAKPEELRRIRVVLTYNSILESGAIFDTFVKGKVAYHLTTTQNRGEIYKQLPGQDDLFVTGGLGDQLFGRDDILQKYSDEELYLPYEDHIDRELLEFVEPAIDKFPTKIKTLFDFGWFYSFNFSWQSVKYHHDVQIDPTIQPRIVNFYGSQEFQRWAMLCREYEPSILKGRNTYKWPARQIILKTIGDKDYVENKLKFVSQHSYTLPNWLAVKEDGTTLYLS